MTESQPRFSETLTYRQAQIGPYVHVLASSSLFMGLILIVAGLWLKAVRGIPTAPLVGILAGGLLFTGFAGFIYYIVYARHFILEVHDSGVYYRTPLMRQLRHVPIEQISDVTWEEGTAIESEIITLDEIWGERSGSSKEASTPALRVYKHASGLKRENPNPAAKEIEFGLRMDRGTDGVVRVDDAENGAVHLFGTDHPEQLANSIEKAQDLAT